MKHTASVATWCRRKSSWSATPVLDTPCDAPEIVLETRPCRIQDTPASRVKVQEPRKLIVSGSMRQQSPDVCLNRPSVFFPFDAYSVRFDFGLAGSPNLLLDLCLLLSTLWAELSSPFSFRFWVRVSGQPLLHSVAYITLQMPCSDETQNAR